MTINIQDQRILILDFGSQVRPVFSDLENLPFILLLLSVQPFDHTKMPRA